MRVIGGEFRSRRLKTIPGLATRPTPDRLRETLFDVLAARISEAVFVDAYAGTGAVGIEAVSRGAARAIFLDRSRGALEILRENIHQLGIEDRTQVVGGPVLVTLARQSGDIVFLDPPYEKEAEYSGALKLLAAAPPTLVIVQHSVRYEPGETHGPLRRTRILRQGDNILSFFSVPE
ncbi:MAG: 16S rRNA (guanine(966)-N(2))-methyltransferase RsmD [Bryobacteraceae bacterium]